MENNPIVDVVSDIDDNLMELNSIVSEMSQERVKLSEKCDILNTNLNEVRNEITDIDNIITKTLHEIEVQSSIKDFLAEYAEGKDE